MVKLKMTFPRLLGRLGFNVVIAGILFSLINSILAGFEAQSTTNAVFSAAIAVGIAFFAFTILQVRPGQETFLSLLLGIPVGVAIIDLLKSVIKIDVTVLDVTGVSLFSMPFVLIVGSYFAADWMFIKLFRQNE